VVTLGYNVAQIDRQKSGWAFTSSASTPSVNRRWSEFTAFQHRRYSHGGWLIFKAWLLRLGNVLQQCLYVLILSDFWKHVPSGYRLLLFWHRSDRPTLWTSGVVIDAVLLIIGQGKTMQFERILKVTQPGTTPRDELRCIQLLCLCLFDCGVALSYGPTFLYSNPLNAIVFQICDKKESKQHPLVQRLFLGRITCIAYDWDGPISTNVAWSVCLCVCLCVEHIGEPCRNGWGDRDTAWGLDSGGPKEPYTTRKPTSVHEKEHFWGTYLCMPGIMLTELRSI